MNEDANNRVYTCPMHPDVRQTGPGNCPNCGMTLEQATQVAAAVHKECPICGMALQPRTVASEEENPELLDMTPVPGRCRAGCSAPPGHGVGDALRQTPANPLGRQRSFGSSSLSPLLWCSGAVGRSLSAGGSPQRTGI
jgi:Heavy metal binding domain